MMTKLEGMWWELREATANPPAFFPSDVVN